MVGDLQFKILIGARFSDQTTGAGTLGALQKDQDEVAACASHLIERKSRGQRTARYAAIQRDGFDCLPSPPPRSCA